MDFDVSLGRSRSGFSNTNKFNLRHRENFVASVWPTLVESARILKPGGYGVFWGLHRTLHWLSWGLEESGLSVLDILMRKVARQRLKSPFVKGAFSTQLVRETESWVLVRKDGETTARENQEKWGTGYLNIGEGKLSNLLEGHLVNRHETDHPSEKSLGWMGELVQLVTPVGGRVLDPFMGSGSTGVSAIENGFKFLGVEKEERWFKVASQRIRAATDSNSILDLMSL
jgi:site-specific DNA-methyltransferase (adenine-specific)